MSQGSEALLVRCFGCGGLFPAVDGPTHRYIESTAGCWAAYGKVLARQYNDAAYAGAGQMMVDAYAVQHPGTPSPQSLQSVALHLISLCLTLEHGVGAASVTRILTRLANDKLPFVWLMPPSARGEINVSCVARAATPAEHAEFVLAWGASVWAAWSCHHDNVRRWLPEL